MSGEFNGEVILVTGAAGGHGAALVELLRSRGAYVFATDVHAPEPGEARQPSGAARQSLQSERLDVADEDAWRRVMAIIERDAGRLDGLVNNAARFETADLPVFDSASAQQIYETNQLGAVLGIKSALPLLRATRGSIVNVASTAGVKGVPGRIAYASSKWAVRGLSKAAAVELAEFGVRVNCVVPGLIDTPMARRNSPEVLARFADSIPLGRMGTAREVAEACAFFLSSRSSYITGAELVVDGGDTA